jgi:hypothetical protein
MIDPALKSLGSVIIHFAAIRDTLAEIRSLIPR